MALAVLKCEVCGSLLDEEDLFCTNCGTEAPTASNVVDAPAPPKDTIPLDDTPHEADAPAARGKVVARSSAQSGLPATRLSTCNFQCEGCGASMSYDASAGTLRCPFCGSERLEKRPDEKEIAPESVIPFAVTRSKAIEKLKQKLAEGWMRPGDLVQQALIVRLTAVYVPYWVFTAETHTYWTADSDDTPRLTQGKWCPQFGENQSQYGGLLVGASAALTAAETNALCPFDLREGVPPASVDLDNFIFERFSVPRKYARPLARQSLEAAEAHACAAHVSGNSRNLKVNVQITNLASEPMLLPVWIMAYKYREKRYRFLVNGQTAQTTGEVPISWGKIVAIVAIAVAGAALLGLVWSMLVR